MFNWGQILTKMGDDLGRGQTPAQKGYDLGRGQTPPP